MISLQKVTDAAGFANMQRAAAQTSKTFRDAAMSTGQFEVQQMRLNSATDDYVKKLRAQKMSFREMAKQRKVAHAAYKQQLAMERMIVQKSVSTSQTNKGVYDVIIPDAVSKDVDTAKKRLAFMNHELRSGATQMLNWGKNTQWAGRQLMVGFTMPVAAFGAAVGVMAYNVDKELTRIAKVYDTVNTEGIAKERELAELRTNSLKTAQAAAAEYGNSAQQTLQVQAELAATGKTGNELQKSTMEIMRISRLGEVDHQTTIDATIALQSLWKLSNDELSQSFDFMNSVENATSLATADFAAAIPIAGGAVREFGGDVKELGVLLTAMKENGIGAVEGANAIKATMQRLGRPSKQIRTEWQALTGTDITKIVEQSSNLTDVFTKINQATRDLDDNSRRKAFAGLFGSYQVARMMAMTQGMEDLENGVGQVTKAFEVSQQSSSDWAKTAEEEIQRYQKSISGQWDIALAEMKAELTEVGGPFVVFATQVLRAVTTIAKAFNDLPSLAKWAIAASIGFAALAGGVLMLVGLTANLVANGLKGIAMLGRFAGVMDLVDTETKASVLAADLASKAYLDEAEAVSLLNNQMTLLAASVKEANAVQRETFVGAQARVVHGKVGVQSEKQQREELTRQKYAVTTRNGAVRYRNPDSNLKDASGRKKAWMNQEELHKRVMLDLEEENIAMTNAANAAQAEGLEVTVEEAKERDKRNQRIRAGAALLAVEATAATAMTINSMTVQNEWVDKLSQGVMLAGLIAPAVSTAIPHLRGATVWAHALANRMKAAAVNTGGFSGALAAAKVGAIGLGRALHAAMGPIGWIAAGVTVIGLALFKVYNDQKKARKQAIKDQKELAAASKEYAENTGRAWRDYASLARLRGTVAASDKQQKVYDQSYEYFKSDEAKDTRSAYDRASQTDKALTEAQMFEEAQTRMGMSMKDAIEYVRAFMIVGGESFADTNARVEELVDSIGRIKSAGDYFRVLQTHVEDFNEEAFNQSNPDAMKDYVKKNVGDLIGAYKDALSRADTPKMAQAALEQLTSGASQGWQNVWDKHIKDNALAMKIMAEKGIDDAAEFKAMMEGMTPEERGAFDTELLSKGMFMADTIGLNTSVDAVKEYEKQVVAAYVASEGLDESIDTMAELKLDPAFLSIFAKDSKEAKKAMAAVTAEVFMLNAESNITGESVDESAKNALLLRANAILAAQGLKKGTTLAEALKNYTEGVKDESVKAASGVKAIAEAFDLAAFNAKGLRGKIAGLSGQQMADAAKSAMGGIQEEIADSERDALDAQIESEKNRIESYWDRQKDALDRRQEREKEALDSAWDAKKDKLEEYWDARIKKIDDAIEREQKAEEARQKMFEAEVARIERLANMANTTIDFNVALNEGNLDEAARITNNATAEDAKFVFDREAERGGAQSERRVEKLEGKKDAAEEAADRAMKAFEKREARAKQHFDRMSKMEQDHLDSRAKADMDANEARWKREKKNLDKILETFLAFTPRNSKQLKEHMESLGISMKNFEKSTLRPLGKKWGSFVRDELTRGLTNAALNHMSDNMWTEMGNQGVKELLKSLGFPSRKQFNKFIKTGQLGPVAPVGKRNNKAKDGYGKGAQDSTYHKGGEISGGPGSGRAGVAKTFHGLHPSETMVRAQKGEYMVNRKDAQKNKPLLDRINSGQDVMGGAGRGPGALISALVAKTVTGGFQQNIDRRVRKKDARRKRQAMYSSTGMPTSYNLPGLKPWVTEAANYLGSKFGISSIGGVGDRSNNPYSDHPRGLALDFMTGDDVAKGWALAKEALKLGPKLDASYMIWQKQIHSFDSRGWRPYSHPSGASNPTLDHMDHVHVSFNPTGKAGDLPVSNAGKLVQGRGGKFHPTGRVGSQGSRIHGSPAAIDIGLPTGNKVYAVRNGVVSSSYDIRGHEPRAPHGGLGYRSYGRVITLKHDDGGASLYAHLSQRFAQAGQRVKAGTALGLSGNTGYSTGPHLHFGATPGPTAYLRKGTEYVKFDNTNATLHRGESVLTKNLTKKMHEGVDRFANGESAGYNGSVININGYNKSPEELARIVIRQIERDASRKPGSRSVGGRP